MLRHGPRRNCRAARLQYHRLTGRTQRMKTLAMLMIAAAMMLPGCGPKTVEAPPPAPPPPTYKGPEYLRGTIGSLATLQGYQPLLVSGYGLVVNLNGTGSADCPPALREWLISEMAKRGFGQESIGFGDLTPEQVLNSDRTAVVLVQGVVPRGATDGTHFDLQVKALPQTQTTSLEGGTLYTTDLRINGENFAAPAFGAIAKGHGPLFINPFRDPTQTPETTTEREQLLVGRVLGGGTMTASTPLLLITNQPSYRLTRQIADRINGRFPPDPTDKGPIAVPQSDTAIVINVIKRYQDNPQRMMDLLSHLYMNPTMDFAVDQANRLADVLAQPANADQADDIAVTWEGMGKTILPILRKLYDSPSPVVRMAALQAGAYLEDQRTADPLEALAASDHIGINDRATRMLGVLLKQKPENIRVANMLRELLDAEDVQVRVAAVDALSAADDTAIGRNVFNDSMEMARAHCTKPMIYVARTGKPRIIIFNDRLSFQYPLFFTTWNNQFMVRGSAGDDTVSVFYKPETNPRAVTQNIPANVPYLVGTMAFSPNEDSKSVGLSIGYSRIVSVLYQMTREGAIDAPFVMERSNLAQQIADSALTTPTERPETAPVPEGAGGLVIPKLDSGDKPSP
ncbi:MAG: hypothetical protein GC162_17405 [Planctomycetes bacterium]|nr:hypothetical protein [Planctomycetota bacterium]